MKAGPGDEGVEVSPKEAVRGSGVEPAPVVALELIPRNCELGVAVLVLVTALVLVLVLKLVLELMLEPTISLGLRGALWGNF